MDDQAMAVSRRDMLRAGAAAAGGLLIGVRLEGAEPPVNAALPAPFAPNAFVRIGTDGTVTVISKHLEMGQGAYTGLATIVAEELDADWRRVVVESAPADAKRYGNLQWGGMQGTGGSSSINNSWDQLRKAGATARAMLVQAAAAQWKVPPEAVTVSNGVLRHLATRRQATFGAVASRAATLPVPADVPLKAPSAWTLIGRDVPRLDTAPKLRGTLQYTIDVKRPGMLVAVVAHPPVFGATVASVDDAKARAIPGVVDVVRIPTGVAVLARNTWIAKQGRDALAITWDRSRAKTRGSAQLVEAYRAKLEQPGGVARREGDVATALAKAAQVMEATFEVPYLTHATLEPMNCVVELKPAGGAELWYGAQMQSGDQFGVAAALGCAPEQVVIHTLPAGGSFGRRANPRSDYILEAVEVAKAIRGRAPVKLQWTREDDQAAGWFRPMYVHRVRAGIDAAGAPVAWQHVIVGQSPMAGLPGVAEGIAKAGGVDDASVEGVKNLAYTVPNVLVENHVIADAVPVQWWRSVGHTHTGFVVESVIDELASMAGEDAAAYRRKHYAGKPRHLAALDLAVARSGWGAPLPKGRGRGLAVHESFDTVVAEVVEVTVKPEGGFTVDRVTCAVDCGVAVNPDVVRAQMEGGIGYALSAALHGEITLVDGVVQETNFHLYKPLRLPEMPKRVDVHIVPSSAHPTGVGEPGTPPLAAALANALFQATGRRVRRLPIREEFTRA
ncbi:MAG: xanthine dehydrogenase family protein molybdopterin-binding subunit [Gemmatimonadales bacterium]|nr:xanthine dehydrogenase family protein molybdopterin-binding subunit [Gemmatimonadales bacterium]